jgi:hypothetical protein
MFDLRPSTEFMQGGVETEVPELDDLDRPRSAEQWRELCDKMFKGIDGFCLMGKLAINKDLFLKYARNTRAKWADRTQVGNGRISDDEAMVRCFVWEHAGLLQRGTALMCLPPHQAIPALRQFDRQKVETLEKMGFPARAAPDLVTQNSGIYVLVWSVERKIDALRVIEAIRAHLATHDGKLPQRLSDITELSLPVDPLTNQPFDWKVSENVGRLSAASIPGASGPTSAAFEYVLRVR